MRRITLAASWLNALRRRYPAEDDVLFFGDDVFSTEKLYRRFDRIEHARSFVEGSIFVSTLQRCRTIEDAARQDPGEGRLEQLIFPGLANYEAELALAGYDPAIYRNAIIHQQDPRHSIRDAWLLCMSTDCDGSGRSDFGEHVVEISSPLQFFSDLSVQLRVAGVATQCIAGAVLYRDRTYMCAERPQVPGPLLKPEAFKEEREVRFLWLHDDSIHMEPRVFEFVGVRRFLNLLP